MRIKGTSKPMCALCRFAVRDDADKKLICQQTKEEVSQKNSCPKFEYDIFKYTPTVKADFGKFSKEDFEI